MRVLARLPRALSELGALVDFWAWWKDELRATLVGLLAVARLRGPTQLAVYIEGAQLTIRPGRDLRSAPLGVLGQDATGRWLTTLSLQSLQEGARTQKPPSLANATLTAVLPPADVLVKELILPAAAERRLDQVLAIQAVSEFPIPVARLYLDYEVVRRIRDTKQIVIHFRAAKRAQLDELSDWALRVGARLDRVCYRTTNDQITGNFLPRPSGRSISRFALLERRLLASATVLLAAITVLLGTQWGLERHQVHVELGKIKVHAKQVRAMWKEIEVESAPAADLIKLMSVPDAASVLGTLPDSLPLDAWATQVEIRATATTPATVNLSAFAPAATRLLDDLTSNPHFKQVHLIYAATDGIGNRGDRVQLSAEWATPRQTMVMPPASSSSARRHP